MLAQNWQYLRQKLLVAICLVKKFQISQNVILGNFIDPSDHKVFDFILFQQFIGGLCAYSQHFTHLFYSHYIRIVFKNGCVCLALFRIDTSLNNNCADCFLPISQFLRLLKPRLRRCYAILKPAGTQNAALSAGTCIPYPSYKEFMQFSRFLMVFAICKENSGEFEESGKNLEKEESCLFGRAAFGKLFVSGGEPVQDADDRKDIFVINLFEQVCCFFK